MLSKTSIVSVAFSVAYLFSTGRAVGMSIGLGPGDRIAPKHSETWQTMHCGSPASDSGVDYGDDELRAAAGFHWKCSPDTNDHLGECVGHELKGGDTVHKHSHWLYVEYIATGRNQWLFKSAYTKTVSTCIVNDARDEY